MQNLNNEELEFIKKALKQRLELYHAEQEHKKTKKLSQEINNCLEKIETGESLNSSQKVQVHSCINENFNQYSVPGFNIQSSFSWISATEEQRKQAQDIDFCKDLLSKTGYYQNNGRVLYDKDFRYRTVFDTVKKLSKSETVLVSKHYKIGFVYNSKETLSFELRSPISVADSLFRFGNQNVKAFENGFELKLSKREALEYLAQNADQSNLNDDDFKFLTWALSSRIN